MSDIKTELVFLGDVHGAFGNMRDQMNKHPSADTFIQVGDMAAFWDGRNAKTGDLDKPVHFIGGNHDNWEFLLNDKSFQGNVYWPKNLFYIPRPFRWTKPISINFLGGADSIDKLQRQEFVSWWRQEIPSYAEFQKFADLEPAEIVVTHTAPTEVIKDDCGFKISDPVSHNLQAIWEGMTYQPKLWFFGHFHMPFDKVVNGTRFICLPCVHNHEFYKGKSTRNIVAYPGVTVTLEDGKITNVEVPKATVF